MSTGARRSYPEYSDIADKVSSPKRMTNISAHITLMGTVTMGMAELQTLASILRASVKTSDLTDTENAIVAEYLEAVESLS